MNLINELESNSKNVDTLTDGEIHLVLTHYQKAGYNFTIPQIRRDKLDLISDIVDVNSKNRQEIQESLRYLRSKSGQYRTNLRKNTADLRAFLFKNTCRFSA